MSSHKIITFIVTVLCALIQVEFQSKNLSPFETHSLITRTFLVALTVYALTCATTTNTIELRALNARNDNNEVQLFVSKISLFFGALACALLMIIVFPVLGWITFVLGTLCFLKSASQLVNYVFIHVLDILSGAIHGHVDQRQEDSLPV